MPPISLPARDGRHLPRRALVAGLLLALAGPGWAGDEDGTPADPIPVTPAAFTPAISVTATQAQATENGATRGVFTFSRSADPSNPRPGALTVRYTLSGSATSGSDYQSLGTSVSFPAGALTVTKSVIAVQDKFQEPDETVILAVQPGAGYLAPLRSATVTIVSDDPITQTVTVAASDASAREDGQDTGTFTFTRSGNTAGALTVSYAVSGSATAGRDYAALGASVSFAAGQLTVTKTVTGMNDTLQEPAETVIVTLKDSALYAPGTPASATVTLADDAVVTPTVNVTASDAEAAEAGLTPGVFTFSRSGNTAGALTVDFAVSGSATSGRDYRGMGTQVSFPAGKNVVTKVVQPLQDLVLEGAETVDVALRAGAGYTLGPSASATVMLQDDEARALNDTGSTRCADDSALDLDCPVSNYPGQDAEQGRDVTHADDSDGHAGFSFTKIANNGKALPDTAELGSGPNAWACTRDNVTGLLWEVKTDDGGLRDQWWTYSWHNPDAKVNGGHAGFADQGDYCFSPARCDTAKYVADVNRKRLCGYGDWRLPTPFELTSLLVLDPSAPDSETAPALDTTYFPNTPTNWFWTAATNVQSPEAAWSVNFALGDVTVWAKEVDFQSVRLVR